MSDVIANGISSVKVQSELQQLLVTYLSEKEENRIAKDAHGMEYWDSACQTIHEVAAALNIPKPRVWYTGRSQGYILALLDAEREVASEPAPLETDLQAEVVPVAGTHTFRKAVVQTESMDELALGIVCGQDCFVQLQHENPSITSQHLAMLFIETMKSAEPESFNVGFLIGFVDALLRARKTYPRGQPMERAD